MKRPVRIDQRENASGEFWYTIRGGNGENTATSKMYRERSRAKRAALAMIAAIAPAPVVFTFWTGPMPNPDMAADARSGRTRVTERIR